MANNLVRMRVTIKGTRPTMWHVFGPDAIPLEKQEREGVAGNNPGEWKKTYTATSAGQLYVSPMAIFGMLREAAKYTKSGRGSIMTTVAATVQVEDDQVLFDRFMPANRDEITTDPEQPVYLDVRSVKNPATKGRNVRYRVACAKGWSCTFSIIFDKSIVAREQMRKVLTDAGTLVGLSDGRSVGFGRFIVENIEESEYEA